MSPNSLCSPFEKTEMRLQILQIPNKNSALVRKYLTLGREKYFNFSGRNNSNVNWGDWLEFQGCCKLYGFINFSFLSSHLL